MIGLVSDIQKFSLHDGPGIRTTVFMKGCNMRCLWCQNPEAISTKPQLSFYPARCIGCGTCVQVCVNGAISFQNGLQVIDQDRCDLCGVCAENCPAGAVVIIGDSRDVNDVFAEIMADLPYYRNSNGGVTISGGEPLLQTEFCTELLQRCWAAGIDTAIETSLSLPYERLESMLPWLSRVFFDIKIMDEDAHREYTGINNKVILENSIKLDHEGLPMVARTPLIPGITDSEENIRAIAEWVSKLEHLETYELLNFNPLTGAKYESIGKEFFLPGTRPLAESKVNILVDIARQAGVQVNYR